jgi:hypothetical protein
MLVSTPTEEPRLCSHDRGRVEADHVLRSSEEQGTICGSLPDEDLGD